MWIRILTSLDPELESESQNGHKSDSGAGSRAGIITPLLPIQPVSHLPWQNKSDSGTATIKVNPTQVRNLVSSHSVGIMINFPLTHKEY